MKNKIKVTFKKHEALRGLMAIGYPYTSSDMKINKKVFGSIYAPNWTTPDNKWTIAFMVKNGKYDPSEGGADWIWLRIKKKFDSESEAKQWIQNNIDYIVLRYEIHFLED